jgi:hypothetical protein
MYANPSLQLDTITTLQNCWDTLSSFVQTRIMNQEALPFALILALAFPVVFPDLFFKRKN